jgi:hypothetical protein
LKKVVFVAKVSNFFHGYLLEVEYFKSVNFERYDPKMLNELFWFRV